VRRAFKIVAGKPEGKKPFGAYTRKWIWNSNVKMELSNLKPEIHLSNI
jgi:hypothetical protein